MRKSFVLALSAASVLGLSACSETTQENAEATLEAAGQDIEAAADEAADAVDRLGDRTAQEAAEVEAAAQNESVSEARRD